MQPEALCWLWQQNLGKYLRIVLSDFSWILRSAHGQPCVTASYMLNNLWDVQTLNTMPHQPTRTCVSQSYVLCKTLEVMALKCYESFSPSLPSNPIYNPPLYLCVSTGRAPAHRSKLCPSFAALLSDFFVSQNFLPLSLALSSFWYFDYCATALPLHLKQIQLQTHLVVAGCITWI